MRVVIQRVKSASVKVDDQTIGAISQGMMILLGIEHADTIEDLNWLAGKILSLRIFDDANGVMNCSIRDVGGEILLVSQFTLHASTKKGNRPSYIRAARPEQATELYEKMTVELEIGLGKKIATGKFGAMMMVELVNDGPTTILMDSKLKE